MFLVTRQQVRPNTSVEFFGQTNPGVTPETLAYLRENYGVNGKQINSDRSISEDGLTLTMPVIWQDEAAFEEFRNDQFVIDNLINVCDAYCNEHGIAWTLVSTESI